MANQGFVQELNLAEVTDGEEIILNLAGGNAANDLKVFQGLSSQKSLLFFDRFKHLARTEESSKTIELGTEFVFDSEYSYTDDDVVEIQPINLIQDYAFEYVGFDDDGVLTNPLAGYDITFDRGNSYEPGTYEVKFKGGGGTNLSATATVVVSDGSVGSVGFRGQISSVDITSSGTIQQSGTLIQGFKQTDVLNVGEYRLQGTSTFEVGDIPGDLAGIDGEGFTVTLTGFPWRVILVGNYAWDPSSLETETLKIQISETSSKLNGIYNVRKDNGVNKFVPPNDSTEKAYDINRKLFAQQTLTTNLELFDIDGDGVLSEFDIDLIEVFFTNSQNFDQTILADFLDDVKDWVDTYIAANGLETGAIRTNAVSLVAYMTGLNPTITNVDGVGDHGEADATDIALMREYIQNSTNPDGATFDDPGYLYQSVSATTSLGQSLVNVTGLGHVIATEIRVPEYPNYVLDTTKYVKPFFTIFRDFGGSDLNIFDSFSKFGRKLTCTTDQTNWVNIPIGNAYTESNIDFRVADKFTSIIENVTIYYVVVVASGNGFSPTTTFSSFNLTVISSVPVIGSDDTGAEYGIFDANGRDRFYLRTAPRSTIDSDKEIVLISETYVLDATESTTYSGSTVPTTTLFPDVIFKRDDSLTLENVGNLEPPEILENETVSEGYGREGGFSYGVDEGYTVELDNVGDTVDQSAYLKDQKYRVDKNLYYQRDIEIDGLLAAYDPDSFNSNDNQLAEESSPGIFISDAGSQVTNNLRSDFAGKTRSFSSDYNPWSISDGIIETTSYRANINDLLFSTKIDIDVRRNGGEAPYATDNSKFVDGNGALNETLAQNFAVVPANPSAYKLKITVNGEDFFIIMKKA